MALFRFNFPQFQTNYTWRDLSFGSQRQLYANSLLLSLLRSFGGRTTAKLWQVFWFYLGLCWTASVTGGMKALSDDKYLGARTAPEKSNEHHERTFQSRWLLMREHSKWAQQPWQLLWGLFETFHFRSELQNYCFDGMEAVSSDRCGVPAKRADMNIHSIKRGQN